jgi:enediyne biosynthesis protein E4
MRLPVSTLAALILCAAPQPGLLSAAGPLEGAEREGKPFAPASTPVGTTLFSRLPSEAIGLQVKNAYDDPSMWGRRYREFMGGAMGSGVAAGDYDGDGNVDLYVSTKTRPGRLFRNLGRWRFEDVTEKAGLAPAGSLLARLKEAAGRDADAIWHQGAVFADVNNDGLPDIYVCRNAAPNLLFVNQGDGTFREEGEKRGLNVVDGSVVGAFADYDRDGWLDVLVLTNQIDGTEPQGRPDRLFRNKGAGYFEEVTSRSGIQGPTFGHAATWFDYNGDGWPDLYVCNDFAGPDHLYRNNRDGTFTNVLDDVVPHTPYSSMGADAADINNDGHIDLLVSDMAPTTREKDRRGLAASRNDVVLMGTNQRSAPQYMRNALLLNTGRGVFQEGACWAGLEATDWTWSVRFEDFDQDGWVDLHVTNGMVREANNSDVLTRMMRALSDEERIRAMKNSPILAEANLAYRNDPQNGFVPVTAAWGLGEVGVSFGAATADFDNDGDLDLVYVSYDAGLSVFRNDAPAGNRLQVRLRGVKSNRFGVGAKIRLESTAGVQVRELIVSRGYASGSELVAHFGLGDETQVQRLTIDWPSGLRQVLANLDANRSYVVSEAGTPATAAPNPTFFQSRGDVLGLALQDESRPALAEKEQAFIPFRTDRRGPALAVADLDNDSTPEIYLGRTTGSRPKLLKKSGAAYAAETPPWLDDSAVEDGPVLVFDADGDGWRDLLVTKASSDTKAWPGGFVPRLYRNTAGKSFEAVDALPRVRLNAGAACASDIDGDGDLDVFLGARGIPGRYPDIPDSILLRNERGRFVDVSDSVPELRRVGLVKSAVFSDVDVDGRPDLVIAPEWNCVRFFRNVGDGSFVEMTAKGGFVSGGRGLWNSLVAADVNHDGRPDFIAGNLGSNTTYRATPAEPLTLLHGDFTRSGSRVLMETVWDRGELYPLRGRNDLATRMPFLLKKYPTNDEYARASLRQIFGDAILTGATALEADNLASGVFLSQQDGTHRFEPFPREAQLAPLRGIAAVDLDGDGWVDVCATQNDDGAVPRFHGGVGILLKGSREGRFTAVPATSSGVLLAGAGAALAVVDATGDSAPDLLLTRHGGASDLLAAESARGWITVKVRGPAGNVDAVGARIQFSFSNGDVSHREIGLGGGWLAQSAQDIHVASTPERRLVSARVTWPSGAVTQHTGAPTSDAWTLSP